MSKRDSLEHVGTPHEGHIPHSGRYKYGSGDNSYQRAVKMQDLIAKYRKDGLSEVDIAMKFGLNTTELRDRISINKRVVMEQKIKLVKGLSEEGKTSTQISKELGIPEPTVRMYLNNQTQNRVKQRQETVDTLKKLVDEHGIIDIGKGSNTHMGITPEALKRAVGELTQEGYYKHEIYIPNHQAKEDGKFQSIKTLSKYSDIEDVKANKYNIRPPLVNINRDTGETVLGLKPPKSIHFDRVKIKYDEEGGGDMDGVMMIRPGAKDLDLGNSKYAQVRIAVGDKEGRDKGTHYLKGMAVYGDPKDFPKGVDIIFNTNKTKGTPKEKVLKEMKKIKDPETGKDTNKIDKDNPFGATIKMGGQKGAINKVNEEGDWNEWGRTLSAQFLSKQPPTLVKEQINTTYKSFKKEFDEINSLTNPVVKKKLMEDFADGLDAKRYSLKLKGIEGMRSQVLLPVPGIKANEIYAPRFKDGERVVLVRYPHGGTFEIPELVVNNKIGNTKAKFMKDAKDAVGIDSSVASKLSGADFDGDTVTVIPNSNRKGTKIKSTASLEGLRNFNPGIYKVDYDTISSSYKQKQMGIVSNLITDMTLKGAPQSEIARAVRHSMVVIDAEKHRLDWKQSEVDNGIPALQKKYQTHVDVLDGKTKGGASTLISRSKTKYAETETYEKKRDPELLKQNPKLKSTVKKTRVTSETRVMDMVDDAKTLGSGTLIENMYGDYANKIRNLGNQARKVVSETPNLQYDKKAKKVYQTQVDSLNLKLNEALSNSPTERMAKLRAHKIYLEKYDPRMTNEDKQKLKRQSLNHARNLLGSKNHTIDISDLEWEAIQKGAISTHKLQQIMEFADSDRLKELAMPKPKNSRSSITPAQINRARNMLNNGASYKDVASAIGVSVDTIMNNVR